jgi:hypothetical protein
MIDHLVPAGRPGRTVRRSLLLAALATAVLLGPAAPAAADVIIGIRPFGPGVGGNNTEVVTIQPSPFSVTVIGNTGIGGMSGLASQPGTGILFASVGRSGANAGRLFTINPATGAPTLVGPTGFPSVTALAFDQNGTLFGSGSSGAGRPTTGDRLITINPATGAGTLVGVWGNGITGMAALAVNPLTGVLYGGGGSTTLSGLNLFTIDKTTGAATLLGPLTGAPPGATVLTGLTFDNEGHLFGSLGSGTMPGVSGPEPVGMIDLATRSFTQLGLTPTGLSDITFGPGPGPAVPEPAALTLFGLGVLGLLGYSWRRRLGS